MNLPNKLTIFRVILIPFFVVFLLLDPSNQTYRYIADAIFIIASLTDMLDGKIARKYNLVTNFGKFMDPLADKLLVSAAMICLIATGQLAAWIVIVIISREFIISGFLANIQMPFFTVLGTILIYVALVLTIVSLIDYIVKNKDVLNEQN